MASDERATSTRLQELSTAHSILHDLKLEGVQGNIDHAVVGPGGAFVIVTRRFTEPLSLRNGMLYAGERSLQPEVDGAGLIATRLSDALGTPVAPVIGFHGGILPSSAPHEVGGVHICSVDNIVRVITRASHTLLAPHKVTEVTERALPLLFNAGSVPRTQIEPPSVEVAAPVAPWIPDPARPGDDAARRQEAMTILNQAASATSPAPAATPPVLAPAATAAATTAAMPTISAPTAVGSATSSFAPLGAAPVGSVSHGTLAHGGADMAASPTSLSELSQMANSLAAARSAESASDAVDAASASAGKKGARAKQKPTKSKPAKPAKPAKGAKAKGAKPQRSRGKTIALVLTLCVVAATAGAAYAIMQNDGGDDELLVNSTEPPRFTRPEAGASSTVAAPMAASVAPPVAQFTAECLAAGTGWGWIATWPGDVANLQQYDVELQNADATWAKLTPLTSSAVTSVSAGGQPPSTPITFRITAVMVDGSTQVGAPATFTTPASPC